MLEQKVYILQRADKLWAVNLPGHERPALLLRTEQEAIQAARRVSPWTVARVLHSDGQSATVFLGDKEATTARVQK